MKKIITIILLLTATGCDLFNQAPITQIVSLETPEHTLNAIAENEAAIAKLTEFNQLVNKTPKEKLDLLNEILKIADQAIQYDNKFAKALTTKAYILGQRGDLYKTLGLSELMKQDYIGSLNCYSSAIKNTDDVVKIYYNIGLIYTKLGKWSKAAENFKITITRNNEDNDAKYLYAVCMLRLEPNSSKTKSLLENIIQTNPSVEIRSWAKSQLRIINKFRKN